MRSNATEIPERLTQRWLLAWMPDNTRMWRAMTEDTPEEPQELDPADTSLFVFSEQDIGEMSHELFAMLDSDPQVDFTTAEAMYASDISYKLLTGRIGSVALEEPDD
jgi:hypothetical protein